MYSFWVAQLRLLSGLDTMCYIDANNSSRKRNHMSAAKKPFSFLVTLGTLAAVGGVAALAVQFYRHPWQTVTGALRLGLLAMGTREGTINVDGLPIHYYCAGRKNNTPIILLHGLGGSAEGWSLLIPYLSKGHMVYAL